MSWGTEYDNACNAADDLRNDKRTAQQRKWDNHEHAITGLLYEINVLKRPGFGRTRKPGAVEAFRSLVLDLARESQALSIEGYREGDPVGPIPTLEPIASKVIKCATLDQVTKAGA